MGRKVTQYDAIYVDEMKNKTCGECKHFYDYEDRRSPCCWSKPTDNACLEFEPKTIAATVAKLKEVYNETTSN